MLDDDKAEKVMKERGVTNEQMDAQVNDDQMSIVCEILIERAVQDAQWGGPAHDDRHVSWDWCNFIGHQNVLAKQVALRGQSPEEQPGEWRRRMIKIAALALAAVASYDRVTKEDAVAEEARQ